MERKRVELAIEIAANVGIAAMKGKLHVIGGPPIPNDAQLGIAHAMNDIVKLLEILLDDREGCENGQARN